MCHQSGLNAESRNKNGEILQNGGRGPQRCHSVVLVDRGLDFGQNDDTNQHGIGFQFLWLKRGDKTLAHEAAEHAIVHRGGILRDVTGMMNMFDAVVTVDRKRWSDVDVEIREQQCWHEYQ